ncbi:hypothetical protein [Streptomyces sp. NPDC054783]
MSDPEKESVAGARRLLERAGLGVKPVAHPRQLSGGGQLAAPSGPFRHWGRVAPVRVPVLESGLLLSDEPASVLVVTHETRTFLAKVL